jgi:hypothetical protein
MWVEKIKINMEEQGCVDMDWFVLAKDRSQCTGSCEHFNEPSHSVASHFGNPSADTQLAACYEGLTSMKSAN